MSWSQELKPDADLHAFPHAVRCTCGERHAKVDFYAHGVEHVDQTDTRRDGRLAERVRNARPQCRQTAATADRLELARVKERVCLDGPKGLAREMCDEARACSPEQVAAERVRWSAPFSQRGGYICVCITQEKG